MLIGRTFSYSDTQRYRVGPNYLQLPVNAPVAEVNTNQRGGPMSYRTDGHGNPHVTFEPSMHDGLVEAAAPGGVEQGPTYNARLTRATLERENNYQQASDRYQTMMEWEREDLITNLGGLLAQCQRDVQERMVWHLLLVDDELGNRVGSSLGLSGDDVRHLQPLPRQRLTKVDQERLTGLGHAGRRPLTGSRITGSVTVKRLAEVPDSEAATLAGVAGAAGSNRSNGSSGHRAGERATAEVGS
jgi:catalase